ncbi:uncharacterized protein LOC126481893 [Schistocerca serialis cubense]|uniref:uncharacterized protein LOC126481893 n=1 Tax=Schistocerca serialis cubense TaxID=2023355 RepID=UPI00214F390B|nr:uncharacterized protein LOC126481893 [Schistocerca serialis cubense]
MWRRFAAEFSAQTSLHGCRQVAKAGTSAAGRLYWVAVIFCCSAFCALFVYNIWTEYEDSPTSTTIEMTNYPLYRIPFPAVTICPYTKIRRTVGEKILARYLNVSVLNETLREQLRLVMEALSLQEFPPSRAAMETFENIKVFARLFHNLNTTRFMLDVLPRVEDIFAVCYWQGYRTNCSNIFSLQRTDTGFCYSFNSLTSEKTRHCPTLIEYKVPTTVEQLQDPCTVRRNIASGPTTGLELFLKGLPPEDTLDGRLEPSIARVSVQPVTEVPELRRGLWLRRGGAPLAALPAPRRRCHLAGDQRARRWLAAAYSQAACRGSCRLQRALRLCRCTPYFFNYVPGLLQGSGDSSACPQCLPACASYSYSVSAVEEDNTHRNQRDGYLDLHYADVGAVMYRRDLTFGTSEFVVFRQAEEEEGASQDDRIAEETR